VIAKVQSVERKEEEVVALLVDGSERGEPIPLICSVTADTSLLVPGAEVVVLGCRSYTKTGEAAKEGERPPLKWKLELKDIGKVTKLADAEAQQLIPQSFDRNWTGKPLISKQAPKFAKISELNPESKAQNLIARVVKVDFHTRVTAAGSKMSYAEAVIGDESGRINLVARYPPYKDGEAPPEKLHQLKEGVTFVFFNTRIEMHTLPTNPDVGKMELAVDRWSTIRPLSEVETEILPPNAEPSTIGEHNMSDVEYTQKDEEGGANDK